MEKKEILESIIENYEKDFIEEMLGTTDSGINKQAQTFEEFRDLDVKKVTDDQLEAFVEDLKEESEERESYRDSYRNEEE